MASKDLISMSRHYLCSLDALTDPGSLGFRIDVEEGELDLFVVRKSGDVTAFINHCPHTGVNLEWVPNRFLDIENQYIQCSMHGALFTTDAGLCVRGPCVGQSLELLQTEQQDGDLYVVLAS